MSRAWTACRGEHHRSLAHNLRSRRRQPPTLGIPAARPLVATEDVDGLAGISSESQFIMLPLESTDTLGDTTMDGDLTHLRHASKGNSQRYGWPVTCLMVG